MKRSKTPITTTHRHRRLRNTSPAACSYLVAACLCFLSLAVKTISAVSFLFPVTAMNRSGSGIGSSYLALIEVQAAFITTKKNSQSFLFSMPKDKYQYWMLGLSSFFNLRLKSSKKGRVTKARRKGYITTGFHYESYPSTWNGNREQMRLGVNSNGESRSKERWHMLPTRWQV